MSERDGTLRFDGLGRREFVAGMSAFLAAYAAGTAHAAERSVAWQAGHFTVHFIYTGVAESMFLVYPDGTSLLIDCGDHNAEGRGKLAIPILPSAARHSGEWIARYVRRVNPNGRKVDRALLTHYHSDHAGNCTHHAGKTADGRWLSGFGQVIDYLDIGTMIDRAVPGFDDPVPRSDAFDSGVIPHLRATYAEMKRRGTTIERFRLEKGSTQLDPLRSKVEGFRVVPLCANGRLLTPEGKIVDLYREWLAAVKPQEPNENPFSIGLRFEYGKFRFYAAGDFAEHHANADGSRFEAEDEMAKVCGPCQVAKVDHHGHRAMSNRLVAALKSRVYVACMWDQLHMTRDTMRRLADRGNYEGERLICPAILTPERRKEDADEAWLGEVPRELYTGTHIILDVPPGGETYSLAFVDAADESMRVKSVLEFKS